MRDFFHGYVLIFLAVILAWGLLSVSKAEVRPSIEKTQSNMLEILPVNGVRVIQDTDLETYQLSGTVVAVNDQELRVLKASEIPQRIYVFVLNERTQMPQGLKKDDRVEVTYTSVYRRKRMYTRTAVEVRKL